MEASLHTMAPALDKVDILVGIASYNNAATIGHVVKAVEAGLAKYFPDRRAVVINSDGGSVDGTPEVVKAATYDHAAMFISHPVYQAHRISVPYDGIPGKGSAFRMIFARAVELDAAACCVVDADLRSITPEWIELLLAPVLKEGFDFVAPLYSRHKYDGTITNSIVYPMTRSLYGQRIRQPIGGDFGFSGALAGFYLNQDVWETHVARFGIDIWMTTEALAGGFKVCQTFLGAKIHDAKDPGADLTSMLLQVVVTLFNLTGRHYDQWKGVLGSAEIPTFGFRYDVGLEQVNVNVDRMLDIFRAGIKELGEIWAQVLEEGDFEEVKSLGELPRDEFRFPLPLWTRVIYCYALAYHARLLNADHLIKSLTPLYLGKTASFVMEVADRDQAGAEEMVEELCLEFEAGKDYLVNHWREGD